MSDATSPGFLKDGDFLRLFSELPFSRKKIKIDKSFIKKRNKTKIIIKHAALTPYLDYCGARSTVCCTTERKSIKTEFSPRYWCIRSELTHISHRYYSQTSWLPLRQHTGNGKSSCSVPPRTLLWPPFFCSRYMSKTEKADQRTKTSPAIRRNLFWTK